MRQKYFLLTLLFTICFWATAFAQFPCNSNITVSAAGFGDSVDLCQLGSTSQVSFNNSLEALPNGFIVTDLNDVILQIGLSSVIDFSTLPGDDFRVYGFNYIGSILAEPGDILSNASISNGCSGVSTNFITISSSGTVEGGTVSTEDGETEVFTCPGDGIADVIRFDSAGVTDFASFTYIVTDDNNNILAVPAADFADFEGAGTGTCRVWGLAYTGNLLAMMGDNAANTLLADGCFRLSENFITVYRENPEGGTVSTEDGETEIDVCLTGGSATTISFDSSGVSDNSNFTYVVTDDNNVILGLPGGDLVDFSAAGPGVCRVWGLAYTGNITAAVGDTASVVALTDDCFDLSDNFVTVNREEIDGGMVMTEDGETNISVCIDGIDDVILFDSTGVTGSNFTYVVTDDANVILAVPGMDMANFEPAGPGVCRVWGLAYTGNITATAGDTASVVELTDGCFDLSDNFITVNREEVDGGMVMTEDGETEIFVCIDGIDDIVKFDSTGVIGNNFTYVVTDDANVILAVPGMDMANFDPAGTGVCRVWGLAYTGNITAAPGDTASAIALTDQCFDLSDNFITVNRDEINGGMVMTEDGETEVYTCPNDGVADVIRFDSTGNTGTGFTYVITDENTVILGLPGTDMQDFDGAGTGTCLVWGLAYTGNITAALGDTAATTMLTDGCFDLSDNVITVYRDEPNGGMVMTEDGQTEISICAGDGIADMISFDSSGVSNSQFTYVVTDDANVILALPGADMVDFDGAGGGVCRVWGLAYTGNITAAPGDIASDVSLTDDCFDLSDNYVTVIRDEVNGGMVMTEDGQTQIYTCPDDGVADVVRFDSTGTAGDNFTYVVTDDANVILAVPGMDMADFDAAGVGVCRVWGLSYSGNLVAAAGDTASIVALSDSCFDLSDNFIVVNRAVPEGGMVMTEDGQTEIELCVGDGSPDLVKFDSTGVSNSQFTYVVTDEANVILAVPGSDMVDFDGAGSGICRVWGLAYTGNITAAPGDTASAVILTDDCFDLSDNFVTVIRDEVNGGMVMTEDGETEIYTCPDDGVADLVSFDSTGTIGDNFTYVVTDASNVILAVPGMDMADFDGAGVGVCRVWGLSYNGSLTGAVGDTASVVSLSDSCFALSNNFITVNRDVPDGGMVMTEEGETVVYTCPGDGVADIVNFDSTGVSNSLFTYVVTDDNNIILALPGSDMADFDGAGVGTCRVWGLAYTGNITAQMGDDAAVVSLTDDCFDLSDNFITVYREVPNGGIVMTEDGETEVYTCPGDDVADIIHFDSMNVSNSQFIYVITNENNEVLATPLSDMADFDAAGIGTCRVWGLAYTGTLNELEGENAATAVLSDDCYNLSENFIAVYRDEPDGGMVMTEDGESEVIVTINDTIPDVVAFDSMDVSNSLFTYVVTDESNVILAVPGGDQVDFGSAGPGICRVWGLAYTGNIIAAAGDTASVVEITDDCYDLSDNFVSVIRQEAFGGPQDNLVFSNQKNTVDLKPWPNPASRKLSLRIKHLDTKVTVANAFISVVNANGTVLLTQRIDPTASDQQVELDVANIPAGLYTIIYQSDKERSSVRFLKQ